MCDTYRYIKTEIFSFNIVIQYWLLGVLNYQYTSMDTRKQLEQTCVYNFDYHFLTTTTKQDIYISISIIVSNIVILYHIMIFLAAIQYYYLPVSHIPKLNISIHITHHSLHIYLSLIIL